MKENTASDNSNQSPVYSRNIVELVTVVVEYCTYLEQSEGKEREDFCDKLLKVLSLLYLKAALTPKYEILDEEYYAEDYVTEENYDIVRSNVAYILGEKDDYLDVFVEDMKYSDSPILSTISENLADIYQEVKNFAMRYKNAADEQQMLDSIALCKEEFQYSWGQKLVNVMRALHEVRYSESEDY